jgi:hypothetical protein
MKLLLNDKEIARFLIALIDVREACKKIELNEQHTATAITWVIDKKNQMFPLYAMPKDKQRLVNPKFIHMICSECYQPA